MSRKVTIPLYDGDDFERMSDLRREVSIAERKLDEAEADAELAGAPLRLGDAAETGVAEAKAALKAAQDAFDALVDAASERAETWVLEPISHGDYRKLQAAHPPREVDGEDGKKSIHPDDQGFDVNVETFGQALLEFVDDEDDTVRTVVAPTFATPADLKRRLKRLAAGEFETFWVAAVQLNSGGVSDPKLLRFSAAAPRSDET